MLLKQSGARILINCFFLYLVNVLFIYLYIITCNHSNLLFLRNCFIYFKTVQKVNFWKYFYKFITWFSLLWRLSIMNVQLCDVAMSSK